jgi:hypothetical protein
MSRLRSHDREIVKSANGKPAYGMWGGLRRVYYRARIAATRWLTCPTRRFEMTSITDDVNYH